MDNKFISLIKSITENKKQFLELLVMDVISLTITLFFFVASIFIVFTLANMLNIKSTIPFDIKNLFLKFSLIWYFISITIALFFHVKTIIQININGQRLILDNEK